MDSSTLQDTVFLDNVAHISGKNRSDLHGSFVVDFFGQEKSSLNPDPASGENSPWRRFVLSECRCLL